MTEIDLLSPHVVPLYDNTFILFFLKLHIFYEICKISNVKK